MPIKRLLLFIGLYLSAALAPAAPHITILSDENEIASSVHKHLLGMLPPPGQATPAQGSSDTDILITIGAQSLQQASRQSVTQRSIIAVMITRSSLDALLAAKNFNIRRHTLHAIVLDQPLTRYLDLIQMALPQNKRIGLLSSQHSSEQIKHLEKLAIEQKLSIQVAPFQENRPFITQVDHILKQCDVLLALPDPLVHNRHTIHPILLATYRANIPVVSYSEAYTQSGALLSLYSTPYQLAQQAAELTNRLDPTEWGVIRHHAPRYFTVSVNAAVARSLGLTLPSVESMKNRLQ